MSKKIFLVALMVTFMLNSCNLISTGSGPGTLGSVEDSELNCSIYDVENEIDALLQEKGFEVQIKDSTAVNWWVENGYYFLNYRCITLKKRLYMITIDSENSDETVVSIRSYYNRKSQTWYFAREFTTVDNYRSKKAMEILLKEFSSCL